MLRIRRITTARNALARLAFSTVSIKPNWAVENAMQNQNLKFPDNLTSVSIRQLKEQSSTIIERRQISTKIKQLELDKTNLRNEVLKQAEAYTLYPWYPKTGALRIRIPNHISTPDSVYTIIDELRQARHGFKRVELEYQRQDKAKDGPTILIQLE
jgi:hypothetical protein